ncbi:MAG: phytanoyl-CoA dioxygenase family protein [Acetobacteraceae bacterium]|nr:phytanoyl-CoA dioxygenase family protein [Acetobacteraceae bacterium]
MLSKQQIEQYHELGYLVVENVFSPELFSEIRQVVAEIAEGAANVDTHNDVYDLEPGHTRAAPRLRRIKTPHKHHEIFMRAARSPEMVAICMQMLGPSGVRLYGSKINLKSPRYGSPVEWHQDWAFYPHTNDDVLAAGVMLDAATEANGAMRVIPGSHKGPTHDHHANGAFCGAMDLPACGLRYEESIPLCGPAGSVSFHHVRLVHGSSQNLSDRSRGFLLYEFTAADAYPLLGIKDYDEFNSRLIAGHPTNIPRMVTTPVRLPLPPAPRQGSIYENQFTARARQFEMKAAE